MYCKRFNQKSGNKFPAINMFPFMYVKLKARWGSRCREFFLTFIEICPCHHTYIKLSYAQLPQIMLATIANKKDITHNLQKVSFSLVGVNLMDMKEVNQWQARPSLSKGMYLRRRRAVQYLDGITDAQGQRCQTREIQRAQHVPNCQNWRFSWRFNWRQWGRQSEGCVPLLHVQTR